MRTHPVNVSYLVLGLTFLGITGCWALTEAGVVDARAGWILPLVLVVAGGAGLVASMARGLRRDSVKAAAPFDDGRSPAAGWNPPTGGDDTFDEPDPVPEERLEQESRDEPGDEEPTQILGDR